MYVAKRIFRILAGDRSTPAGPGRGGPSPPPVRETRGLPAVPGKARGRAKLKEAGDPVASFPKGIRLEVPRLPRATEPDSILRKKRRTLVRKVPWTALTASAAEQASIAASGNQRPAGPWKNLGSQASLWLRAEAGSYEVQPGGRPSPRRKRPRAASPHRLGAQTEHRSRYIINHPFQKNKGSANFF
jgi:hypothetical protein